MAGHGIPFHAPSETQHERALASPNTPVYFSLARGSGILRRDRSRIILEADRRNLVHNTLVVSFSGISSRAVDGVCGSGDSSREEQTVREEPHYGRGISDPGERAVAHPQPLHAGRGGKGAPHRDIVFKFHLRLDSRMA